MKKDLINKLLSLNIKVKVVDGNLKVNAPKGALTPELLTEIKSNKDFLVQLLAPKVKIPKTNLDNNYPLTPTQYFMWFTHEHLGGNKAYNITSTLQLDGDLNVDFLTQAFQTVIKRHDSLRTIFIKNTEEEIVQHVVAPETSTFQLLHKKLSTFSKTSIEAEVEKEYQKAFKLDKEILVRAKLIGCDKKHILLFVIHHIIGDGWSLQILAKEVMKVYNSLVHNKPIALPTLSIQYKDYSVWLTDSLATKEYQNKLNYWKTVFSEAVPVLELPTYQARPIKKTYNGCVYSHEFSTTLIQNINTFTKEHQMTLFMMLLGSINGVFSKYTGQTDITLGTTVAGRSNDELTNLIGLFSNALPIRTKFATDDSFLTLLQKQKTTLLKAYDNKEYPFTELVKQLSIPKDQSRSPLFDIMVLLQNHRALDINDEKEIQGIQTSIYDEIERGVSQQDITFIFEEKGTELLLNVEYNTDLFEERFITQFISHFEHFISNGLQQPETTLTAIAIISKEEEDKILYEFNSEIHTRDKTITVVDLLTAQAKKQPNKTALIFENEYISYAELDQYSSQLANFLVTNFEIEKGNYLGIELARNEWMIIAIYAVLKTEAIYVPIDPSYPEKRKKYIYTDSDCKLIINDELIAKFRTEKEKYQRTITPTISAEDVAYVIYTSGSTGNPKGVQITHCSLLDYTRTCQEYFNINTTDKLIQQASISFDTSIEEIFPILSSGGALVIQKNNNDFEGLLQACEQHEITILSTNPFALQYLNQIDQEYNFKFRILISGGDILKPNYIDNLWGNIAIYNTYGPTESTVCATYYKVNNLNNTTIPIGKPITNRHVYILEPNSTKLSPIGIPGELCIAGTGLAKNYLNKPELTAEKFIPNPFQKGEKLYRTGDLGKWLPDGNIVFEGRKDDQVKIRGYRIELGEIEYALTTHENINQAVVLVKEKNGEKSIVAYIVGTEIQIDAVRTQLVRELPEYMLPNHYMVLDAIPITSNGKTDKKALLALEIQHTTQATYSAPQSNLEKRIVAIWENLLDVAPIGLTDNFFELGGHSLKIVKFINIVKKEFNCKLSVHDIFAMPTIEALVASGLLSNTVSSTKNIQKVAISEQGYALSPSQYRLWVLSQFEALSTAYNMPYDIILDGTYDFRNLDKAIHATIERHEILRTVCKVDASGEIRQWILSKEALGFNIEYIDYSDAESPEKSARAYITNDSYKPFNLATGPLLRVAVLQVSKEKFVLYYNMHHIISDGWSMEILAKDIMRFYEAYQKNETATIAKLDIQYKDYAAWQLQKINEETFKIHEAYWLHHLAGELPVLDLPTNTKRPLVKSYEGNGVETYISKETTEKLKTFSKEQGGSLFISLLAVWNLLLQKYSSSTDIIIGTSVAGRDDIALENQIGFYVNTLALRNEIQGDDSFITCYEKIKNNTLASYEHQAYPFDRLVEKLDIKRDANRNAVFDVMLTMHNANTKKDNNLETLHSDEIRDTGFKMSKLDVDIICKEVSEGIQVRITYNTSIYDADMIHNLTKHYKQLLEAVLANSEEKIKNITYLTEVEKNKQLLSFNTTKTEYNVLDTALDMFQHQVVKTPTAIALQANNKSFTYVELDEISSQFANYLSENYHITLEDMVGIHLEKSEWMLISIMAILKCGSAYVPLDLNYPKRRIQFIQEETNYKVCITKEIIADFKQKQATFTTDNTNLEQPIPANLAYVIYTSGSTGKPKGVQLTHGSLANYVQWAKGYYLTNNTLTNTDFGLFTSLSFDLTVTSVFLPIVSGGKLVVSNEDEDISEQLKQYFESTISCIKITPAHISILPKIGITKTAVEIAIVGGDILTQHHVGILRNLNPNIKIYNEYGPTEATVGCTIYEVGKTASKVLIGKPIANTEAYILDTENNLQAEGIVGELCISGKGLAKGYLNRNKLTAEKFIPHPFKENERIYKTGDLAKWLPDGNIVLFGRIDNQVKINGYRIELQEIERQLRTHPEITQAVVCVKEIEEGTKELIAFIVATQTQKSATIRSFLMNKLPTYMLPNYTIEVAEIPLTPNGKRDTQALVAINTAELESSETYIAPTTNKEKVLIAVWEDVLKRKQIGIHDNFYNLGGDSIKSIQIVARLKQKGYQVKVEHILQNPIVESLAKLITTQTRTIPQDEVNGVVALTPIQQYFFTNEAITIPNHFNQSVLLKSETTLDITTIHKCISKLVAHHDALRMKYTKEETSWKQINQATTHEHYELHEYDLRNEAHADAKMEELGSALQASIDITTGPLVKVGYFKQNDGDYIALIIHHLVVDGISWRILLEDFSTAYTQFSTENNIQLPLKTDAFMNWASAQKEHATSPEMITEKEYWNTISNATVQPLVVDYEVNEVIQLESKQLFSLTEEETTLLQTKIPNVYKTEINDILLTTLGLAIKDVFQQEQTIIQMEGHGREDILKDIDISRTIGWFTSMFPFVLDLSKSNKKRENLIYVKEALRKIPNKGIGYGILRYLTSDFNPKNNASITFNYLGDFGNNVGDESNTLFEFSSKSIGKNVAPENGHDTLLDISGMLVKGALHMSIRYSKAIHKETTIQKLITAYKTQLQAFITDFATETKSYKTPSDLTYKGLSVKDIVKINKDNTVVDIYKLSPLQKGMYFLWLSNASTTLYFEQTSFTITVPKLTLSVIEKAYQKLIDRHAVLRTSFSNDYAGEILQIVRNGVKGNFSSEIMPENLQDEDKETYIKNIKLTDRETGFNLEDTSQIRLKVLQLTTNTFHFIWSYHHILMDAWSANILIDEYLQLIQTTLTKTEAKLPVPAVYATYIQLLESFKNEDSLMYWKNYLSGYNNKISKPFVIKNQTEEKSFQMAIEMLHVKDELYTALDTFCIKHNITQNVFIQGVWGYLISLYNNINDVVFGMVVSGRPAELQGVENMVGLFINTIPVRINYTENDTVIGYLETIKDKALGGNDHHYLGLSEIQYQNELGKELIHHTVTFENLPLQEETVKNTDAINIESPEVFEEPSFDFDIIVVPFETAIEINFRYNTTKYEEAIIKDIVSNYTILFKKFLNHPTEMLTTLKTSVAISNPKKSPRTALKNLKNINSNRLKKQML
ncbi:amino acid adenylation domain-containing protein [Kordia sp.]|uniref:amino acid adenylation domain-containing protein n=1 Tax=Kordia sp. TaxID=1965332 RepID=UPI003D2BCF63